MKQKRIIQQLVKKSKIQPKPNNHSHQDDDLEQQSTPTNEIESIQCAIDREIANISVQLQPAFNFEIYVEIGDGRSDIILMNERSNAHAEADKFCIKHGLDKYIVNLLAESLEEQARKQKKLVKSSLGSINNNGNAKNMLPQKSVTEDKIYKFNKNSQQLWKEQENVCLSQPKINEVSEAIVQKMGKENIITAMNKKFHDKVQQHIMQQLEIEQRQFQSYSFHPNINPISRKVDQTLNYSRNNSRQTISRYEYLYGQHKLIENKKQIRRRNSLMDIPFRPVINKISRTIMSKKRSAGELYPLSAGKRRPKSSQKYAQSQDHLARKNKVKINQNTSLSASTSQLCYHLYQEAKKRQQKMKKQTDRIYNNNETSWKIIQNSNSMVNNLRENRIKQIFYSLTDPPHKILHHLQINLEKLSDVQRIFIPVFNQMKDVDTDLTEEEFVQAGLRLLKFISPNQRAILIRKNPHFFEDNKQKQNNIGASQINKKSREIVKEKRYGQQNIYMRGLMFRKQVKNQIEKGKQQKVRKQLKGCTFKPKIHKVPQNAGY